MFASAALALLAVAAQAENMVLKGSGIQAQEDGLRAADEGRFADALPLLERVVRNQPMETPHHAARAARVNNALGGARKALGRPSEAADAFERALAILDDLASSEDAEARNSTLEPKEREEAAERAQRVRFEAATVVNNLGAARAEMGRTKQAATLYKRALKFFESEAAAAASKTAGPQVADVLNNWADLLHGEGELDEALEMHQRALQIRELAFGADDRRVAGSLNNVAVVLMEDERHEEALPLLRRAASSSRDSAGENHTYYATALNNLAGALVKLGRQAEAAPHLRAALAINEQALGEEHASTRGAAENLRQCEAGMQAGVEAGGEAGGEAVGGAARQPKKRRRRKRAAAK